MRVTLVVPPFSTNEMDKAAKLERSRLRPLPPLSLGYLAGELKTRSHKVTLVDAQAAHSTLLETADAILADEPQLVGISGFTVFAKVAYALARELKSRAPDLPIVFGGPHATSFHEEILDKCPAIDWVIPGEAEHVFADLVDRIADARDCSDLEGILYRGKDGRVVVTPPAPCLKDLDKIPFPARDIFARYNYTPLPNQSRRRPATTVMTSRGCPWAKCKFCYQGGKYASSFRRRSPENVIEELRSLSRDWGFREIIFWDDNFCIGERWIREFCDRLDAERLDLTWTVQGRVDTVTPDMLKRMAASGCYNLFLGFESGNQELLDLVSKGITLEQSRRAVQWGNEAGLEIRGAFMFALPTETPEMAERTIRFACELDVDYMIFVPYHVQRGTQLEELAKSEGRLYEHDEFDFNAPTYVPKAYASPEEIAVILRNAYRRFYFRPRYILRALRRYRNPLILRNHIIGLFYWLYLIRKPTVAACPVDPVPPENP